MLTEEQISLIQDRKAEQRRAEQESNTTGSRKYCCMTCFHFKASACDGLSDLQKVCEQWYSPESQIQGLAYSRDKAVSKNDQRRSVVAALNSTLRLKINFGRGDFPFTGPTFDSAL